jgi:hypothetical protein
MLSVTGFDGFAPAAAGDPPPVEGEDAAVDADDEEESFAVGGLLLVFLPDEPQAEAARAKTRTEAATPRVPRMLGFPF